MGFPLTFKLLALSVLCVSTVFGSFKVETGGAPPAEAAAYHSMLNEQGVRVLKADGSVLMQVWFAKALPSGGAAEENTAFPEVPNGAVLGLVHFPARHADRRGQTIKPGFYTMRYSRYPVNGDHMGVAPQRDFAVLSVAEKDTDPAAQPNFARLMSMSRVASGTPHPLVLSIWQEEGELPAGGIEAVDENETILHARIGAVHVAIIIAGVHVG